MIKQASKIADRIKLSPEKLKEMTVYEWMDSVRDRGHLVISLTEGEIFGTKYITDMIEFKDIQSLGRPDIKVGDLDHEGATIWIRAKENPELATLLFAERGHDIDADPEETAHKGRHTGNFRDQLLPGVIEAGKASWVLDMFGDFRYFRSLKDMIDWLGTIGDVVEVDDEEDILGQEEVLRSATNVVPLGRRQNTDFQDQNESDDKLSDNIPALDNPVYPSAIIGDSAIPLQGQFHESEYKDDNYVGNTWKALINSYYS